MFKLMVLVSLLGISSGGKLNIGRDHVLMPTDTDDSTVVSAQLAGNGGNVLNDITEVKFYLYTAANPIQGDWLAPGDDELFERSNWIKGAPVKIVSHGFGGDPFTGSALAIKNGLLSSGRNLNIISVDWGKFAAAPWYDTAAANTRPVGHWVAFLMEWLIDIKNEATLQNTHFVGHSLGTHVGGFLGAELARRFGQKMGRITATDPALPLFGQVDDGGRLDPTDAEYVDVIHTAGGTLFDGGLAFKEPRGHIDFYPNEGLPPQPGCAPDPVGACSHSRSYEYFVESVIVPSAFEGCLCDSWEDFVELKCPCNVKAFMGEYVDKSHKGLYFLRTNSKSPFGHGPVQP